MASRKASRELRPYAGFGRRNGGRAAPDDGGSRGGSAGSHSRQRGRLCSREGRRAQARGKHRPWIAGTLSGWAGRPPCWGERRLRPRRWRKALAEASPISEWSPTPSAISPPPCSAPSTRLRPRGSPSSSSRNVSRREVAASLQGGRLRRAGAFHPRRAPGIVRVRIPEQTGCQPSRRRLHRHRVSPRGTAAISPIADCQVISSGGDGLVCSGSGLLVTGNRASACARAAIWVEGDGLVSNNLIGGGGHFGLRLGSAWRLGTMSVINGVPSTAPRSASACRPWTRAMPLSP